jgi:hypothetical protein
LTSKILRLLERVFLSFLYSFVVILKWSQGYLSILIFINYCLNLEVADVCFAHKASGCCSCFSSGTCSAQIALNTAFQGDIWCISPTPSQWWGTCSRSWHGEVLTASFSLPPSCLSLLLENLSNYCKKTKKSMAICLLS